MKKSKKQKKEQFSFGQEYKRSWNYIKESREFIYSVALVFFIFAIIGFLFPPPGPILEKILALIEELLEKTQDMSQPELISFIFFNNLQSSFFGIVLGIFLGFIPILFAISNGYLLGFVAAIAVSEGGFLTLWRVFPHGIFELPAVFISLGLGVKLGSFIFQKNKSGSFKKYLFNSLRVFLLVVLPLLVVAAIIEGGLIFLVG